MKLRLVLKIAVGGMLCACACSPAADDLPEGTTKAVPVLQLDPSKTHPWLFAHDLKQTDGYKYRTQEPWKSWLTDAQSMANTSLSFDFAGSSGDWEQRGVRAADLAFIYQLNGGDNYRDKAVSAVLNMNKGSEPNGGVYHDQGRAIFWWALAYDLIQPSLDATQDATAKDNLARMCDNAFWKTRAHSSDGGSWTEADAVSMSGIGLGGLAIIDWKDPNHLGLRSNLSMWLNAGTEYFYKADPYAEVMLEGRPIADMGLSPEGQDIWGGNYIHYTYQSILIFAEAYSYYMGRSMAEDYPRVKGLLTEFIWETTPPGYLNCRMTSGGEYTGPMVTRYWNLLDATNQAYLWAYAKRMEASVDANLLEFSNGNLTWGYDLGPLEFLSYRNPQAVKPQNPTWTTRIVPGSLQQTFRSSWDTDATWLSETTMSSNIPSAIQPRVDFHQDQLGIEWWSKGNPWLADGSEDKAWAGASYGALPIHHNVLMIEHPRAAFKTSSVSGLTARGLSKGSMSEGFNKAPATVTAVASPWMNAALTSSKAGWAFDDDGAGYEASKLDAEVQWERQILFPQSEYFLVADRATSSKSWGYDTLFTPTSHDLKDSSGALQNINLQLFFGGSPYAWEGLTPKTPTAVSSTNSMMWKSRNVHHAAAQANLFTVPASPVVVDRLAQRGYGNENAQAINYMPHVLFKQPAATAMYRVTALIANLATEAAPTFAVVPVTGTGNALSVERGAVKDFAYTGSGASQFGSFATDADTVYARAVPPSSFTFVRGTHLDVSNAPLISSSVRLDYLSWRRETWGQSFKAKSTGPAVLHLYGLSPGRSYVARRDGTPISGLQVAADGKTATLSTEGGEHYYELADEDAPPPPDAALPVDLGTLLSDGGQAHPRTEGGPAAGDGSAGDGSAGDGGAGDGSAGDGGCECQVRGMGVTRPAAVGLVLLLTSFLAMRLLRRPARRKWS